MQKKYNRVTISLPIKIAQATQLEAAKVGLSISKYIELLLGERFSRAGSYAAAQKRYAARPAYIRNDGAPYPVRDELYDK